VLALAAIILAPRGGAQAQDAREEGPFEIEKCRTIEKPGSYKLVNNLTFTGTTGTCLTTTASFVTIDLAGFTITGPGPAFVFPPNGPTGIAAENDRTGIAVRNGTISGFLSRRRSWKRRLDREGIARFGGHCPCDHGIGATGIVRAIPWLEFSACPGEGTGISATGIVAGNYVTGYGGIGLEIGLGSTVIGNTAVGAPGNVGIAVSCPCNLTDNTAVNNAQVNLE